MDNTYGCDRSDPTQPQCKKNSGMMNVTSCALNCSSPQPPPPPPPPSPPSPSNYACDWSNSTMPVCKAGAGTQNMSDCMTNCKAVSYALCNYSTGQCEVCSPSQPGCIYTQDYCNVACKPATNLGVYRGNQINLR